MRISKSRFVAGCQCLKRLYLQVHQPELAAEPDASAHAIMEQGYEVGLLARPILRLRTCCRVSRLGSALCAVV